MELRIIKEGELILKNGTHWNILMKCHSFLVLWPQIPEKVQGVIYNLLKSQHSRLRENEWEWRVQQALRVEGKVLEGAAMAHAENWLLRVEIGLALREFLQNFGVYVLKVLFIRIHQVFLLNSGIFDVFPFEIGALLPVSLDDELGRGSLDAEDSSSCCYSLIALSNQLDKLHSFLSKRRVTFREILAYRMVFVCPFIEYYYNSEELIEY